MYTKKVSRNRLKHTVKSFTKVTYLFVSSRRSSVISNVDAILIEVCEVEIQILNEARTGSVAEYHRKQCDVAVGVELRGGACGS